VSGHGDSQTSTTGAVAVLGLPHEPAK
jgi:hypothetical protein